ncbi:MAG: hypothetical protein GKS00_21925 [Alphaproteobacteria bacterium]|nr:hypothetical protein [Alphaproteobacteria bacterium]
MAFDKSNLTLLSQGNGFGHYRYDTLDLHTAVDASGYIGAAADQAAVDMLKVGDTILVVVWATTVRTGTVASYGTHIVVSNDGTNVDLSDVNQDDGAAIADTD